MEVPLARNYTSDQQVAEFVRSRRPGTLSAVHRANWTWYYYGQRLMVRMPGRSGYQHYDNIIDRLFTIVRERRSKTPWREANLIWMSITRITIEFHKKEESHV